MSKEYIGRKEAILAVRHAWAKGACPYEDMRDFAEVVQGRWISVDSSYWKPTHSSDIPVFRKTYRCSECRRRTAIAENY